MSELKRTRRPALLLPFLKGGVARGFRAARRSPAERCPDAAGHAPCKGGIFGACYNGNDIFHHLKIPLNPPLEMEEALRNRQQALRIKH